VRYHSTSWILLCSICLSCSGDADVVSIPFLLHAYLRDVKSRGESTVVSAASLLNALTSASPGQSGVRRQRLAAQSRGAAPARTARGSIAVSRCAERCFSVAAVARVEQRQYLGPAAVLVLVALMAHCEPSCRQRCLHCTAGSLHSSRLTCETASQPSRPGSLARRRGAGCSLCYMRSSQRTVCYLACCWGRAQKTRTSQ
jgi:hypothetical protein